MRRELALLVLICLTSCGEDDSTGPTSDFPRAFTSVSRTCTGRLGVQLDPAGGVFIETTVMETNEESSDPLFSGEGVIIRTQVLTMAGEVVDEDHTATYRPGAVEGTWEVNITSSSTSGAFTATGTGTGALAARSIELQMQLLPSECGYTSSGTIR